MNISIRFICNQELIKTTLHPATTVLDFLRKNLHLSGTKEACREGDCGACTILVGEMINGELKYQSVNSCLLPIGKIHGKHIVTIEGLNQKELNPIQNSIVDEGGTQCGFCTPGFIMSATGYLLNAHQPNIKDLIAALDGNICRCTGYNSIKRALENTVDSLKSNNSKSILEYLVEQKILPNYFLQIPDRLKKFDVEENNNKNGMENSTILISGGTDLFVQKWDDVLDADVAFIHNDKQSKTIWNENNVCFINANTAISEIKNSALLKGFFPNIDEYFQLFGSTQIRNSATVGGNIVNASPIGDLTIFFLALNSTLHLKNKYSSRTILMKNFYKGYKDIDLKDNEILELISFVLPGANFFFNFEKVSRRTNLDIASVNSAIYLLLENDLIKDIIISAGGVSAIPMILENTSAFLIGKEISNENILSAVSLAQSEISPITDVRGSAEYKSLLLRQIILSHFLKLLPQLINVEELI